jgi:hypothetical protein
VISEGLKDPEKIGSKAMKQFLISSFVLAFLLGTAPAMADSDQRRGVYTHTSVYDKDRAGPQHKKFLTSRYRDDHGHRGHDRRSYKGHRSHKEHGWRGHPGKKHHGWKKGKRHGWNHGYHGQQRHGYKHRHYRDRRSSYRFHYNGLIGAGVSGGHISIDLSRHFP